MKVKRVTILTGHYGSGKTSLAVNWAIRLSRTGKPVAIADLDIVNPYFRTTDHRRELEESGVRLVGSPFAGSNLDIPALPRELYAAVEDHTVYAVLDVGGDDRGAVALGRYVPSILTENNYEMVFVTNFFRPLTKTPEAALTVLREVEAACGLSCTGLVNNSNLGAQTTARDVLDTAERMERLSVLSGLPVLLTAADRRLYKELEGRLSPLLPLDFSERKS
ncbi:MAG: hypothetical protein VB086_13005 [Clostridiaceae bacterium]|nr:hypothetical protein [Clostridiaceae bacterium]